MTYKRWQKRKEPVSHIDDWLMTYADMITLLLCFFAIFLSVSLPKKDADNVVGKPHAIEQVAKPQDKPGDDLPSQALGRDNANSDEDEDPNPKRAANASFEQSPV